MLESNYIMLLLLRLLLHIKGRFEKKAQNQDMTEAEKSANCPIIYLQTYITLYSTRPGQLIASPRPTQGFFFFFLF
jgi:hypothetical protein